MFDSSSFKENLPYFQRLLSDGVFESNISGAEVEGYKDLKKLALCNLTKPKWLESSFKLKDSKSSNHAQEIEVEYESELSSSKDLQNLNLQGNETNDGHKKGLSKFGQGSKEPMHKYDASFTPGTTDSCHILLESCHDEHSDQDLLLDVPFNGCFPEAELLIPPSSSSIHSAKIHH